jgi:hypothetical protein
VKSADTVGGGAGVGVSGDALGGAVVGSQITDISETATRPVRIGATVPSRGATPVWRWQSLLKSSFLSGTTIRKFSRSGTPSISVSET